MKNLFLKLIKNGEVKHIECNYIGQELDNNSFIIYVDYPGEFDILHGGGSFTMEVQPALKGSTPIMVFPNQIDQMPDGFKLAFITTASMFTPGMNKIQYVWRSQDASVIWKSEVVDIYINESINAKAYMPPTPTDVIDAILAELGNKTTFKDVDDKIHAYDNTVGIFTRIELDNVKADLVNKIEGINIITPDNTYKVKTIELGSNMIAISNNQDSIILDSLSTGSGGGSADVDLSNYYTKPETNSLLNNKANLSHTHAISDVTNLQTSLDAKADTSYVNTIASNKVDNTDFNKYIIDQEITDQDQYTLIDDKADQSYVDDQLVEKADRAATEQSLADLDNNKANKGISYTKSESDSIHNVLGQGILEAKDAGTLGIKKWDAYELAGSTDTYQLDLSTDINKAILHKNSLFNVWFAPTLNLNEDALANLKIKELTPTALNEETYAMYIDNGTTHVRAKIKDLANSATELLVWQIIRDGDAENRIVVTVNKTGIIEDLGTKISGMKMTDSLNQSYTDITEIRVSDKFKLTQTSDGVVHLDDLDEVVSYAIGVFGLNGQNITTAPNTPTSLTFAYRTNSNPAILSTNGLHHLVVNETGRAKLFDMDFEFVISSGQATHMNWQWWINNTAIGSPKQYIFNDSGLQQFQIPATVIPLPLDTDNVIELKISSDRALTINNANTTGVIEIIESEKPATDGDMKKSEYCDVNGVINYAKTAKTAEDSYLKTETYNKSEVDGYLSAKANSSHTHITSHISGLSTLLAEKAPTANPTFTGSISLPAMYAVTFDGAALSTILNGYVGVAGNQSIYGIKTFASNPLSSAVQSTSTNALTRKDYVDGQLDLKTDLSVFNTFKTDLFTAKFNPRLSTYSNAIISNLDSNNRSNKQLVLDGKSDAEVWLMENDSHQLNKMISEKDIAHHGADESHINWSMYIYMGGSANWSSALSTVFSSITTTAIDYGTNEVTIELTFRDNMLAAALQYRLSILNQTTQNKIDIQISSGSISGNTIRLILSAGPWAYNVSLAWSIYTTGIDTSKIPTINKVQDLIKTSFKELLESYLIENNLELIKK